MGPPLQLSERARLRELDRENREPADEGTIPFQARGGVLRGGASVSEVYEFIDVENETTNGAASGNQIHAAGGWKSRSPGITSGGRARNQLMAKRKGGTQTPIQQGLRMTPRDVWVRARCGCGSLPAGACGRAWSSSGADARLALVACQPRLVAGQLTTQQGCAGPIPTWLVPDLRLLMPPGWYWSATLRHPDVGRTGRPRYRDRPARHASCCWATP